jgi:hypothetical protein
MAMVSLMLKRCDRLAPKEVAVAVEPKKVDPAVSEVDPAVSEVDPAVSEVVVPQELAE